MIEEKIIKIRAVAEGVKAGIEEAARLLGSLQDEKEITITLSLEEAEEGIVRLRKELAELIAEKDKLKGKAELDINTENLKEIEKKLVELNDLKDRLASEDASETKGKDNPLKDSDHLKNLLGTISGPGEKVFDAVRGGVEKGIAAYSDYEFAMQSLSSQMDEMGISMVSVMDVIQEKTAGGLLSAEDTAEAVKNLTAYGMSLNQASLYIDSLTNAAAYNRDSQYSVSQAVVKATEGIKNQSTSLSAAGGMTKSTAQIVDDYAKSLGKTTEQLTQAERANAVYSAGVQEMAKYSGDAAAYSESLGASQERLKTATNGLYSAFGEALAPAVSKITGLITTLLEKLTSLIKNFGGLTSFVTITVGALAGLVVGINGLVTVFEIAKKAVDFFNGALNVFNTNPTAVVIGLVVTALAALALSLKDTKDAQSELNQEALKFHSIMGDTADITNIEDLMTYGEKLKDFGGSLGEYRERFQELQGAYLDEVAQYNEAGDMDAQAGATTAFLKQSEDLLAEFKKVNSELIETMEESGNPLSITLADFREGGTLFNQVLEEMADNLRRVRENFGEFADGVLESQNAIGDTSAVISSHQNEIKSLSSAYQALSKSEGLSQEELLKLSMQYPEVAKLVAENEDSIENLMHAIENQSQVSRQAAIEEIKNKKSDLETTKETLIGKIDTYKEEMNLFYQCLEDKRKTLTEFAEMFAVTVDVGMHISNEATLAAFAKIEKEVYANYEKVAAELNTIETVLNKTPIDLIGSGEGAGSYKPSGGSSGASGGSRSSANQEPVWQKQLTALDKMKAAGKLDMEEEIQQLDKLLKAYGVNAEARLEIEQRLHEAKRALADKNYDGELEKIRKKDTGNPETTDYADMISAYKNLLGEIKNIYSECPELIEQKENEISEIIKAKTEERIAKIIAVQQRELEERLSAYDRQMAYLKQFDGMDLGGGEIFKFGIEEEKDHVAKKLNEVNASFKQFFEQNGQDTEKYTKEQAEQYKRLSNAIADLQGQYTSLTIAGIKERKKALEAESKEHLKNIETIQKKMIANEKEKNTQLIESIKERYQAQIQLAEESANAEISIYEDKIKAIDDMLKAEERAEADQGFEDKTARLKQMLAFETDDSNKYELQKEIDSLTAENSKRKKKESLEDEKDSYRAEIDKIKENLSLEKELLKEAQEAEITRQNNTLKSYIENLESKYNSLKESLEDEKGAKINYGELTNEELQKIYDAEVKNYRDGLDEKERETKNNNDIIRGLVSGNTDSIIEDLNKKVELFSEAGRKAGSAWASAYQAQVSRLMDEVSDVSDNNYNARMLSAPMSATNNNHNNNIQLYQSIHTPTASPSQVAKESKKALENALKYV